MGWVSWDVMELSVMRARILSIIKPWGDEVCHGIGGG